MRFSITHESYEPEKDYILITYEGEITMNVVAEYAPKVVGALRDYNCLKLVEDYRKATVHMDSTEIIDVQNFQADYLTSKGIPFINVQRALVVDDNLISHDDMSFFETLSVNRGQKFKVFTDMVKAIKWICPD